MDAWAGDESQSSTAARGWGRRGRRGWLRSCRLLVRAAEMFQVFNTGRQVAVPLIHLPVIVALSHAACRASFTMARPDLPLLLSKFRPLSYTAVHCHVPYTSPLRRCAARTWRQRTRAAPCRCGKEWGTVITGSGVTAAYSPWRCVDGARWDGWALRCAVGQHPEPCECARGRHMAVDALCRCSTCWSTPPSRPSPKDTCITVASTPACVLIAPDAAPAGSGAVGGGGRARLLPGCHRATCVLTTTPVRMCINHPRCSTCWRRSSGWRSTRTPLSRPS